MTRTRQRRSAPEAPAYPVDQDGDRIYQEEDYALPDEWAADDGYTPEPDNVLYTQNLPEEALADLDAYAPDEAFQPDEESPAPESEWVYDPFSAPADGFQYSPGYAVEDEVEDPLAEDLLTDEERAELRRSNWSLLSGLADFAGIIVGTAVILLLVALLVSLLNWLMADISQTFTLMQMRF